MKLFSTKAYKIKNRQNNAEGSTVKPTLVSVIPGKNRGFSVGVSKIPGYIITKVDNRLYECIQSYKGKSWWRFRCKAYRNSNENGHDCKFTVKVRNISGVTEKENAEVFWRKESWEVMENLGAAQHCCTGILHNKWHVEQESEHAPAISGFVSILPDVIMSRILSYLSIEDIYQIRTVSHQMESLAKVELKKKLKALQDWRLDYIMGNGHDDQTAFDDWRIFQLSKEKLSSCTETRLQIGRWVENREMRGLEIMLYDITEDFFVYIPFDEQSIEVINRRDQTSFTISIDIRVNGEFPEWELLKLKNNTVVVAHNAFNMFHMKSWKLHATDEVNRDIWIQPSLVTAETLAGVHNVLDFDIYGDFVIIQYWDDGTRLNEVWLTGINGPTHIPFPNWDTIVTSVNDQSNDRLYHSWTISTEEQIMVAMFSTFEFSYVLVFNNFTSPNYLHRITLPPHVHFVTLNDVDVGNGYFKTVLVAQNIVTVKIRGVGNRERYCAHIYDVNTGELIETLSTDESEMYHDGLGVAFWCTSGPYIFPALENFHLLNGRVLEGINVFRLNWNGKTWNVSTHFIPFPTIGHGTLCEVTDTFVTWQLHGSSHDSHLQVRLMLCDYLLH